MRYAAAATAVYFGLLISSTQAAPPAGKLPPSTLPKARHPSEVSVYWENDSTFLKPNGPTDRHYTNGMAVTFAHQPDWAQGFADWNPLGQTFDRTAAGYIFGQEMFTPDNIRRRALITDDRPYAGYLFAGLYLQRANDNVFDHAQLDLGIVGPSSGADSVQRGVHSLFSVDKPRGWDNQLHDEPTIQLTLRRKWRDDLDPLTAFGQTLDQQVIPYVELGLGTLRRYAAVGATYRIGVNFPDDFGPGRLAAPASFTAQLHDTDSQPLTLYGFIRGQGKLVEHNLLLEGNTYRSSPGVTPNPLIGELQAGFAVEGSFHGWRIKADYAQTFLSEQYEDEKGAVSFGAITLSASHAF